MPDPLGWQALSLPWGGLNVVWEHHKGLVCWEVADYSNDDLEDPSAAFLRSMSEELVHHSNPALHLQEILIECSSGNWRLQKILNAQVSEEDKDLQLVCNEYIDNITLPSLLAMIALSGTAYTSRALSKPHVPKATLEYTARYGTLLEKRTVLNNPKATTLSLEIMAESPHEEISLLAKERLAHPPILKKLIPFFKGIK